MTCATWPHKACRTAKSGPHPSQDYPLTRIGIPTCDWDRIYLGPSNTNKPKRPQMAAEHAKRRLWRQHTCPSTRQHNINSLAAVGVGAGVGHGQDAGAGVAVCGRGQGQGQGRSRRGVRSATWTEPGQARADRQQALNSGATSEVCRLLDALASQLSIDVAHLVDAKCSCNNPLHHGRGVAAAKPLSPLSPQAPCRSHLKFSSGNFMP